MQSCVSGTLKIENTTSKKKTIYTKNIDKIKCPYNMEITFTVASDHTAKSSTSVFL